jgi:hypothetical protein
MQSRKVTLASTIVMDASRQGSQSLPMDSIINQIRIRVAGTYSGIDGTLAAEFPFNIFRAVVVKTSKGAYPYSLSSKDLRIMNYLDKSGKVTMSASGGAFEANIILDRGELLSLLQNNLPDSKLIDHPSLPFGGLTLALTWAQDADITTGANALTAATATIILEQTPVTVTELQAIYGTGLERYQMPQIYVKGDSPIVVNTKPSQAIILDVGALKKRTIVVTSDTAAPPVRSSAIATQLQLYNGRTGWERTPIDRPYKDVQNEDAEQYNLGTILAGVASIDYPDEINNDPYGFPSWRLGDKDLQIYTQDALAGNIRVIENDRIVNVNAFESGNILGVVTGAFKALQSIAKTP